MHVNERLRNFISGLVAGVISVTVCNPLDIARTRLNVLVYYVLARMPLPITVITLNTLISHKQCGQFGKSKAGEVSIVVNELNTKATARM